MTVIKPLPRAAHGTRRDVTLTAPAPRCLLSLLLQRGSQHGVTGVTEPGSRTLGSGPGVWLQGSVSCPVRSHPSRSLSSLVRQTWTVVTGQTSLPTHPLALFLPVLPGKQPGHSCFSQPAVWRPAGARLGLAAGLVAGAWGRPSHQSAANTRGLPGALPGGRRGGS